MKDEWDLKQNVDHLFPKSLDGFVFILSREGDIVYINESVSKYLGIQQVQLFFYFFYFRPWKYERNVIKLKNELLLTLS